MRLSQRYINLFRTYCNICCTRLCLACDGNTVRHCTTICNVDNAGDKAIVLECFFCLFCDKIWCDYRVSTFNDALVVNYGNMPN